VFPFSRSVPKSAARNARRWAVVGCHLTDFYDELRDETLEDAHRGALVDELRNAARELAELDGGW
jgi:hypothetical protein